MLIQLAYLLYDTYIRCTAPRPQPHRVRAILLNHYTPFTEYSTPHVRRPWIHLPQQAHLQWRNNLLRTVSRTNDHRNADDRTPSPVCAEQMWSVVPKSSLHHAIESPVFRELLVILGALVYYVTDSSLCEELLELLLEAKGRLNVACLSCLL